MQHFRLLLSLVIFTVCTQPLFASGVASDDEIPTTSESSEVHVVPSLEEVLTNGFTEQIKSLTDELEAQISQADAQHIEEALDQTHVTLEKIVSTCQTSKLRHKDQERLCKLPLIATIVELYQLIHNNIVDGEAISGTTAYDLAALASTSVVCSDIQKIYLLLIPFSDQKRRKIATIENDEEKLRQKSLDIAGHLLKSHAAPLQTS